MWKHYASTILPSCTVHLSFLLPFSSTRHSITVQVFSVLLYFPIHTLYPAFLKISAKTVSSSTPFTVVLLISSLMTTSEFPAAAAPSIAALISSNFSCSLTVVASLVFALTVSILFIN